MKPVILSLCDFTGTWSQPYENGGYNVIKIDLKTGDDIRFIPYRNNLTVYGILMAPPCTCFANSGARWNRTKEEMIDAISIVDACLRTVVLYKPLFWVLENPVGKLKNFLGKPRLIFNPNEYGNPYTKKTCLWGRFKIPKRNHVEPYLGSIMHTNYGGKSPITKIMRSVTPTGFANAFFMANDPLNTPSWSI